MTMSLFTEVVGLRSRQKVGTDELNNDTYDWVEEPSPAWLELRQGTENTDARESSTSNQWLYLPLETPVPVEAVSQVRWRGQLWDVSGDPGMQPGGFVVEGYQQLALTKVTG